MASPREPALCQLYRHTFVPYCQCLTTYTLKSSIALCNWAECVTVIGHNVTTKFQCISVVHWMPFGIRILTACFEWHSAYFKMTLLAVNCPCTDVKNWVVGCWRGYLSGRYADLHVAQLMPLPLTVSCSSKIQIGFTFLVPAHPGSPGQRAVKRWVCVCAHAETMICKHW